MLHTKYQGSRASDFRQEVLSFLLGFAISDKNKQSNNFNNIGRGCPMGHLCRILLKSDQKFLTRVLHKVDIFEKVWKGIDHPSEYWWDSTQWFRRSYYWRRTEDGWVAGRTDILWPQRELKKKGSTIQRYMKLWKSWIAIYKPQPEQILFLHMPKGAAKLCKYIVGSGPMFLCYTDWKFSCTDWKQFPKILNLKLKD